MSEVHFMFLCMSMIIVMTMLAHDKTKFRHFRSSVFSVETMMRGIDRSTVKEVVEIGSFTLEGY